MITSEDILNEHTFLSLRESLEILGTAVSDTKMA